MVAHRLMDRASFEKLVARTNLETKSRRILREVLVDDRCMADVARKHHVTHQRVSHLVRRYWARWNQAPKEALAGQISAVLDRARPDQALRTRIARALKREGIEITA